jgi:DNA-binding LacI/PurR family transcriptional regulator
LAASLDTVARAAGVSISTVSRALSRPDLVSAGTRERVLAIAGELGYRANTSARGLATGRRMAFALLVPDVANPFFPELIRAAEDRAQQSGYSLLLCDTGEHAERERHLLSRVAGQVDGAVVCSPRSSASGLAEVATELPTVLVNRLIKRIPSVSCVSAPGMTLLVEHLYELGHRRVAYLQGPLASWSNRERLRAVREAARRLHMVLHVLGPFLPTLHGGHKAAEAIMGTGATAALAFDDLTAMGVVGRLWDLGVHVPGDVSVTGCDDIFCAALCSPPLTTVRSLAPVAGTRAVELLLEQIGNGLATRARHLGVIGEVVIRSSTGAARSADAVKHPRRASSGGGRRLGGHDVTA